MSKLLLTLGDKTISATSMIFPDATFNELVESGFKILGHVARPIGGNTFGAVLQHGPKISSAFTKWAWGGHAISGVLEIYDDHLDFSPKAPLGLNLYKGFDKVTIPYEKIIKVEAVRARLVYNFADVTLAGASFRISVVTRRQTENVVRIIRAGGAADAGQTTSQEGSLAPRAFRRSQSSRLIGGVCGGIAQSTGVMPWVWRVGFVVSLFFSWGLSLLVYALLWALVPNESSTS